VQDKIEAQVKLEEKESKEEIKLSSAEPSTHTKSIDPIKSVATINQDKSSTY